MYISEEDIIEAFEAAGLNPADFTETEGFGDTLREQLSKAMAEAAKQARDQLEAETAAELEEEFQRKLAGKSDHERVIAILERRKVLEEARSSAILTDEQLQTATRAAIEQTAGQLKAEKQHAQQAELAAMYQAELNELVSGPYYMTRVTKMAELKQKYRAKGLRGLY